jgi:hypothetical protein
VCFGPYVGCDGARGVDVVVTEMHEYPSCDCSNYGFKLYKRRLILKGILLVNGNTNSNQLEQRSLCNEK